MKKRTARQLPPVISGSAQSDSIDPVRMTSNVTGKRSRNSSRRETTSHSWWRRTQSQAVPRAGSNVGRVGSSFTPRGVSR